MQKFVHLLLLALSFVAVSSFADENTKPEIEAPARDSSFTLGVDRNPDHQASLYLNGDFAFGETPRALFDYQRDSFKRNANTDSAASISLGIGADFTEAFFAALRLHRQSLPGEVYAKGGELSGSYRLGDWRFGLDLKILRYTSDRSLSGKRLRESGILERSGRLSLSYKIAPDWKIHASGTKYSYGGATPGELSDILASRAEVSSGLLSAVEGFPTRSGNFGVGFQMTEKWSADLSFARTNYELAPVSTSVTLFTEYECTDSFAIGLAATNLKQDGLKTGSVIGLQGTYTW